MGDADVHVSRPEFCKRPGRQSQRQADARRFVGRRYKASAAKLQITFFINFLGKSLEKGWSQTLPDGFADLWD